jgi:hypothetical protein
MRRQPGFSEAMRAFLLRDVLSDPELAAEMDAGKGAAHFNMQQYQVSGLCCASAAARAKLLACHHHCNFKHVPVGLRALANSPSFSPCPPPPLPVFLSLAPSVPLSVLAHTSSAAINAACRLS